MKKIMQYVKPFTLTIWGVLALKFIAAMMDLFIPSILEKIIDDIIPMKSERLILLWGGVMLVCAAFSILTNVTANRNAARISGKITLNVRHDLFEKISYLSARQMDSFTSSSLISRLTSDTYNVNQMLARMMRLGVRAPILLIGGILITLTLDPVLTLVLLAMLPIIAVIVYIVTTRSIPVYTGAQKTLDKMVRTVQENITGIRVIKALSKSAYERARFDRVNTELSDMEQRASLIMASSNPATTLVLNIGLTLVVLVGAYRVNGGMTQPGKIIAFLSYFTIILNAMIGVTRIFIICTKGIASANRISDVLVSPDAQKSESKPVWAGEEAHICFDHVHFSYDKVEDNLSDISFSLKRGQTMGIIGSTGSGKTTIINLLMRFYDVDKGAVYVDGQDVRSMKLETLRIKFGVTFQNDFIMADTIRENIDYGRGLKEDAISRAVHDAQAEGFIADVEGGIDYQLAVRGNNISGGQKQRILIARALAANPEILILDDASSALDYKTDAALRKALHTDFADTTSVIIAQRVSSIKNADLILVLEDGKIIGSGRHDDLMASCVTYRQIAQTQMGGENHA